MSEIRCDSLPGCNYKIFQAKDEFCYTTDTIFLSAFVHLKNKAKVLELGAGTGAMSLLLAWRGAEKVVGIDCKKSVTELMKKSISANALDAVVIPWCTCDVYMALRTKNSHTSF